MNSSVTRTVQWVAWLAAASLLAACGGGGGGAPANSGGSGSGGGGGDDDTGDDARRMVLTDIGENIILPALEEFAVLAAALETAVVAYEADPADAGLRSAARDAWRSAMSSWQYSEPLQVGPAGLSSGLDATPGGANLRSFIYAFPLLDECAIEQLAANDVSVTPGSAIDTTGLGAVEFLLFNEDANPCALSPPPTDDQRATYAASVAGRISDVADDLLERWSPSGGDFLSEWSTAGDGSMVYDRPQDALDALSVALFYVEKDTKDDKIADPIGLGATGLSPCPTVSCPERLESRLSGHSGENIRANVQAFLDVFTGVASTRGINELLTGINRADLATKIVNELETVVDHLPNVTPSFDAAVEAIPNENDCINASANPTPDVLPICSLHGYLKWAMDTFRTDIVGSLSLATPNRAAGDND